MIIFPWKYLRKKLLYLFAIMQSFIIWLFLCKVWSNRNVKLFDYEISSNCSCYWIPHLFPIFTEKRAPADYHPFLRSNPLDALPAFMYQARPRYIKRLLSSLYENANKRAPSNENVANLRGDDVSDLMSLLEMNGQE